MLSPSNASALHSHHKRAFYQLLNNRRGGVSSWICSFPNLIYLSRNVFRRPYESARLLYTRTRPGQLHDSSGGFVAAVNLDLLATFQDSTRHPPKIEGVVNTPYSQWPSTTWKLDGFCALVWYVWTSSTCARATLKRTRMYVLKNSSGKEAGMLATL